MVERCTATTKAGKPCNAPARPGRPYYLFHDPAAVEERRAASKKGGHNKSNAARAERRLVKMSVHDVQIVLTTAMREVFDGNLDIGTAAARATLGRAVILANEKGDLEKRVAEIEEQIRREKERTL